MHDEAHNRPQNEVNCSEDKKLSLQKPCCVKCKSNNLRKKGFRTTKYRGKQQRWICNECNKSFTVDKGFWKMKFNEKKITQAIDTYYEGLSLRKVRRNFYKYADVFVSHQSVLNWIRKYSYLIREYVKKLQPQLSGHYMTDEVIIRCKKENHNFGAILDKHTRYIVATRYSEYEYIDTEDNIKLWKEAKNIQKPYKFSSDCHMTYEKAFNKVFWTRYKKDKVEWNRINTLKTGKHNYIMERVWNSLRERIKIMRGFKASWSAKLLLDGYFIWYNFIRPHMTLRGCPAKIVGLENNDLIKLIELSC